MACYLRMTVRRPLGEALMASRPFGRREMVEAGLRKERGKGPRMALNIQVGDHGYFDFRGQLANARRFLRRYQGRLAKVIADPGFRGATLDFGVGDAIDGDRGPAAVMFFHVPKDLVAMAGELGLGLEISIWWADPVGPPR